MNVEDLRLVSDHEVSGEARERPPQYAKTGQENRGAPKKRLRQKERGAGGRREAVRDCTAERQHGGAQGGNRGETAGQPLNGRSAR